MSGINIKIGTISTKFHYPYEGIFGKASPGPEYIIKEVTGNGYINLTNAVANHLMELKAYGGTEQRNLSYTQLEYIQGSGTQYIDTGIKLNQNNTVEVKYCYHVESSTLTSGRIFGARYSSGTKRSFSIGSKTGKASAETFVFGQFGDNNVNALNNIVIGQRDTYKLSADGFYVNDIKQGDLPTATFETPFTVKLFAFEQATSSSGTASVGCGTGRCKEFKVLNGDTLVMDLIPARNTSNVIGMYDLVSGQFFANAGTGTFTAGPDVVPTPTAPIDIVSNNGTIKFSKNMANVNSQTALVGYYISTSGVVTADSYNRIYQDFIPCKPNTTYTLSCSSSVYFVTISEYSTAEDSGFVIRKAGSSGGNTRLTITTGANTNYLRFGANLDRATVTMAKVLAINWQLEIGDTPTPYHEYVEGGIYTDGTTETINIHTKNLFSGTVEQGSLGDSSGAESQSSVRIRSTAVPVKPNTQYNLSWVTNSEMAVNTRNAHFYDASNTWISRLNASTFTTPSNAAYVRFVWQHSNSNEDIVPSDISNVQLELGNTATTYVPYFDGGTATAEMLLKVGTYQDEQEILSGNITRNIGVKVLDGTEDGWDKTNNSFSNPALFADKKREKSTVFCSHFQYDTGTTSTILDGCIGCASTSTNTYFRYDTLSTVEQFQQWLADQYNAGTPVIVIYPLETPTTETATGQTMNIPAGSSTIEITQASIDNLGLYAKYKATS